MKLQEQRGLRRRVEQRRSRLMASTNMGGWLYVRTKDGTGGTGAIDGRSRLGLASFGLEKAWKRQYVVLEPRQLACYTQKGQERYAPRSYWLGCAPLLTLCFMHAAFRRSATAVHVLTPAVTAVEAPEKQDK